MTVIMPVFETSLSAYLYKADFLGRYLRIPV